MDHKLIIIMTILSWGLLGGCSQDPDTSEEVFLYKNTLDINYGEDICSYSNEVIDKVRYGGRITMTDGENHKFMSVECTAGFYLTMDDQSDIESIEIVDFAHGQKYLPVDELVYLRSNLQPSPGGMNLTPIEASNEKMRTYIHDAYPGDFYNWNEVLKLVQDEWNLAGELTQTVRNN